MVMAIHSITVRASKLFITSQTREVGHMAMAFHSITNVASKLVITFQTCDVGRKRNFVELMKQPNQSHELCRRAARSRHEHRFISSFFEDLLVIIHGRL